MEKNLSPVKILITGGAGFLGKTLVRELLAPDSPVPVRKVRILDLKAYEGMTGASLEVLQGDIRDYATAQKACEGMDVVIHSAAIVDWGTRSDEEVYGVNVEGTATMLKAAQQQGVQAFVYTSSIDAIYTGAPLVDIDESLPYPERHPNMYCKSKCLAEQMVLAASRPGFSTCALRPADVYGEGDPYHIDSLVNMAKSGFFVRIGDGSSRCQHSYVGNVAHAHLLAAQALLKGKEAVAGEAYFITDGPGANFFRFFDQIITGAGYRFWPSNLWLPRGLTYFLGTVSEGLAWLVRPVYPYYPKLSRFAVTYTCTDFTYTAEKARLHFGFSPKYSEAEAVNRTVSFYQKERRSSTK